MSSNGLDANSATTAPGALPLAEAADLFVQFANAQEQVLWVIDLVPHERSVYISPAFESIWGHRVEDLYADVRLWSRAIHPDDRASVTTAFDLWIADPVANAYDVEYRIVRPDGKTRWIHDCAQAPLASAHHVGRRTGIAQDISERRNAIAALQAEQQREAAIAEVAPGVVHTLRLRANGTCSFVYGGARLAQLYGLPAEAYDANPGVMSSLIHPDDMVALETFISQSALDLSPWHADYRVLHPDGDERWIRVHSTPVLGTDGVTSWHGVATDISAEKTAERALFESQSRLAAVVSHMTEGLLVFAADGELSEWNPAVLEMFEVDEATANSMTIAQASQLFELRTLAGEVVPVERWPHSRVIGGEVLRKVEHRVRRIDAGWEKVFTFSGQGVHDTEGRPRFSVVQCRDITARRRSQEEIASLNASLELRVAERTAELEAAVKELDAFSYSVSHDLRAPLRAIDGFSQALIEDHGKLLPESGRRYLDIIRDTAQKMGQLIDDLLAFSRLSRQSLTLRPINTVQLVRHAYDALAPLRLGRNIELRVADLPNCEADLALLRQVWINLLGNAIKYTRQREAAVIEVGSNTDASGATEYFVRDNGAGFDMRYAHKLFGPFERLHRADEFEGTGVGLAIVQRIVQRHGGRVRALGELDNGATFFFTLGASNATGTAA